MPQNNGRKPLKFTFSKRWLKKAAKLEEGLITSSPLAINPEALEPEIPQSVDQPTEVVKTVEEATSKPALSMADWLKSKKRRKK